MAGASGERVDVALVGGGGATLAVLQRIALGAAERRRSRPGAAPFRVAVVDPQDRLSALPADRTWCSWWPADDAALALLGPAVHRSWNTVSVVSPDGEERRLDLGGLRYVMVRSEDWYARVADAVQQAVSDGHLCVTHVSASATSVSSGLDGALVRTPLGDVVAGVALDSRPHSPARPGATTLLQHFRGERVRAASTASTDRTRSAAVDPDRPVLMDFTVPQPEVGLAFGYCLPSDDRTALVEYTEFSPAVLDDAGYTAALSTYRSRVVPGEVVVEHTEQGVIPMTDGVFARRAGRHVLRLGTGGGAVRPSSGYAFAAMQRQAAAVAADLLGGRDISGPALARGSAAGGSRTASPPRPYPRRHTWMDSLLLRALADGSLDGAAFFPRLFARNPPERVLRFLDGATSPREDLALMRTSPLPPMLRATALDAAWRARRAAGDR